MSEPKLCPFRPPYLKARYEVDKWAGDQVMFAPCLQDKCAMWRKGNYYAPNTNTIEPGEYCGLAGKPQ